MIDFGVVEPGTVLYIPFDSFAGGTGASITLTGLLASDIEIYKDGSVTQRASDSGYALLDTDGIDFDAITGIHGFSIDLADNTTAGFYAAGSQYFVVISSVTVDTQTVNFVAARFQIGYRAAILNTTIATLASQTSFTLTSGPAEDDALNGMWCLIHDVASAVQKGHAVILDYTGATKTVTLAAGTTFTAAATDNISVMGPAPLQPTTAGRTLTVEADGMAHADLKEWLGTAPLSLVAQRVSADATAISGDSVAADNLENAFDDTAGAVPWQGIIDQGTAQSATATTLVLRAAAAFADNTLFGAVVQVHGSTQGYWQTRDITANTLADDTATVDAWTVTPTGTITYRIFGAPPAPATPPAVNVTRISGDSTAADNAEAFFDGTGYAGTNNVIPTVTTLTNDPAGVTTLLSRVGTPTNLGGAGATVGANLNYISQTQIAGLPTLRLIAGTIGATGNTTTTLHITGTGYGDDEPNDLLLIIRDVSAGEYHPKWVEDFVAATDLFTVATLPFTPEASTDTYQLFAVRRDVRVSTGGIVSGSFGSGATIPRCTLVDTTTTNTDMRGTNNAALASVCTEGRLAELDAANLPADVDQVKADLPQRITKNVELASFPFFMVLSSDHVTGATGKTVTATRSLDGAAFAACANAVSEIANGWYKITLAATDLNANTIALKFTATDCDARNITILTQPT